MGREDYEKYIEEKRNPMDNILIWIAAAVIIILIIGYIIKSI